MPQDLTSLLCQSIVDSLDGLICICDADDRILFMNGPLKKRTGRDATGEACFKVLHDREQRCPDCATNLSLQGTRVTSQIFSPLDSQWYELVCTPLVTSEATSYKLLNLRNITQQKVMEENLHLFQELINQTNDAIFILDPADGHIIYTNQQAGRNLGYDKPDGLIGLTVRDISLKTPDEATMHEVFALIRQKGQTRLETQHICKDGSHLPVEVNSRFTVIDGNEYIISIARDISERKKVETELLNQKNLVESVITALGDGITVQDKDFTILYQNKAHRERQGDHVGAPCYLAYQQRDDICPSCQLLDVFRDGAIHRRQTVATTDQGTLHMEVVACPVLDENGTTVAGVEVVRDITYLKEMEEQYRRLNEELEVRVAERTAELQAVCRELESFSYSVSHDLRAPMRHISSFSQLILDDYGDELHDDVKGYLNRIGQSAGRLGRLIDDLLVLARLGQSAMHREKLDLAAMARDIMSELQLADSTRTVQFDCIPSAPARGDRQLMQQVLTNLLGNSWKYTGRTENPIIEFGSEQHDGQTCWYVKDNGAGFDMAYADALFCTFQRLHTPKEFEGTGIGLATVQRIINRHGGKVWGEGIPGAGAIFRFTLGPSGSD